MPAVRLIYFFSSVAQFTTTVIGGRALDDGRGRMNRNRWPSFETAYWLEIRFGAETGDWNKSEGQVADDASAAGRLPAPHATTRGRASAAQSIPLQAN